MLRARKTSRKILNHAFEKHINNITELAQRMDWSISTCSKKINNPQKMSLQEAKKLCELTGINIEELIKF